jgi:CubicO group peptidase (beta-lactamase class C family)
MRRLKIWLGTMLLALAGPPALTQGPSPLQPVIEPAPAPASPAVAPAVPASPGTTPALTRADLDAWLDGFMPLAIGRAAIPGAVVVVVQNGQVLTQRGYGFADVAKRQKVDPATTLFRPGSISKLFTWTAVMQLVEQGKLNLDEDVNRYLDFQIPPYQGKPITLRQIMTHTAGFEKQVKDIITEDAGAYIPYDQLLKRWIPKRVFAPGTTPAYSNYATSLAGYIVQRVSGQSFDNYIEQNIFVPLGMTRSSFRQPLPDHLKPLMSQGYAPGESKPMGFEFVGPAPAGSLSASGEDMARFMIAHLQNGAFGNGRILSPRTAQLMHSQQTRPIPGLNGMALGFYQHNINGRWVIAHGGDTNHFHSDLHLFLNEGVGLYVSFNSVGKEGASQALRGALLQKFADRYFPAPEDNRRLGAQAATENAQKLAGTWAMSRRIHSSFLSILDLVGQTQIDVGENGELIAPVAETLGLQPPKWVAAGPMLWRDANSHELLGAKMVDREAVRFSLNSIAPIVVLDRVPWYRNSSWLLPLLYLSLAVLLSTALLWPIRALVRRRFGAALALAPQDLRVYRSSRIAAVAIFSLLVGWAVLIGIMASDVGNFSSAFDAPVLILQLLSAIVFIGGFLIAAWYAWRAWRGKWSWPAKLWSVLLVIAAATILHIALVYHLIGFATDY